MTSGGIQYSNNLYFALLLMILTLAAPSDSDGLAAARIAAAGCGLLGGAPGVCPTSLRALDAPVRPHNVPHVHSPALEESKRPRASLLHLASRAEELQSPGSAWQVTKKRRV